VKPIFSKYSQPNKKHYVPGMLVNGMLYVSGQTSLNPLTGEVAQSFSEQVKQALKNIEHVLEGAGMDKNDVVMCHGYITDISLWPEFNQAYAEYFGDHKPARVVVPVVALNNACLVEIEAIATKKA
jgi:2-iminobutanoate/2-iminopropanoate deaminase